jgi:hypothetical protein
MKTERITILATSEFKAFLSTEAAREKVSLGELVRSRCEQRPTTDMKVLKALTKTLRTSIAEAKQSLQDGLEDARTVLSELKLKHKH